MAVANLAFVIFLSLRNTPLTFLTAYSYERLNVLHQVAGYSTIAYAMAHAVVYIVAVCYKLPLTNQASSEALLTLPLSGPSWITSTNFYTRFRSSVLRRVLPCSSSSEAHYCSESSNTKPSISSTSSCLLSSSSPSACTDRI